MRRFDGLAHLLREFGEKPANDIVRREAVRVLSIEILLANIAVFVDIEKAGMRHPFGHTLRFYIKDIKAANDLGIWVGQQRKFDIVPLREVHEDGWAVVANCSKLDALLFESSFSVLQLHELRFAERSPVGGTEEKENRSF